MTAGVASAALEREILDCFTAYEAALVAIARGFAHDAGGVYRERLREKQQLILGTLRLLGTDAEEERERSRKRLNAC